MGRICINPLNGLINKAKLSKFVAEINIYNIGILMYGVPSGYKISALNKKLSVFATSTCFCGAPLCEVLR